MDPQPPPSDPMLLYKYTSEAGLKRFLSNLTLKFSPAGAFNDPFEIHPIVGTREERKATRSKAKGFSDEAFYDYDFVFGLRNFLKLGIGINIGILCLSEVVEKYRRCAAVPIWMVGQESVARRLGS